MYGDIPGIYLLGISILALAVGPLLYQLARLTGFMLAALDGFIFVAMGGLVLLHVMPESFAMAGWPAIAAALLGLLAPGFVEHRLHGVARQAHAAALLLALFGLGLHAFMDGMALVESGQGGDHAHHMLPMAVLLHRLPVGLTIWFLLRSVYGVRAGLGALGLIAVSTMIGFGVGEEAIGHLESQGRGLFQAVVAGSLLHVVLHRSYPLGEGEGSGKSHLHAGLGALGGLALLWGIAEDPGGAAVGSAGRVFWNLAFESAPALLLAYVAAGLVYGLLPRASMVWMGRGGNFSRALRGMGFGLPLPICSCGVVPVYRSLVLQGVPATAAMSFLIATPELSLDAVLISVPLLGAPFTVVRVVCAALVALLIGWGIGRLVAPVSEAERSRVFSDERGEDSWFRRLGKGLKSGLGEVVDSTAPWILLGLAIAALMEPLLQKEWIELLPDGLDVLFLALAGIPAYVCASGATPLVAVLIYKGVSPGAALAFLLTGPATNITTFGVLARLHGRRIALIFGGGIMVLAVALGLLVNRFTTTAEALPSITAEPQALTNWQGVCLLALASLFLVSLLRQGPRGFVGELFAGDDSIFHEGDHHHEECGCAGSDCGHQHA